MITSGDTAAVIDPQRDIDIYLETAARNNATIRHDIETHLHADFVSGHTELAQRTGARIYLGDGSGASFEHAAVRDGDTVEFGSCRLDFLQTPGHTAESICITLTDLSGSSEPKCVFTGDTLFIGDVGRPDLSATHTPRQLAALLYSSLHDKVLKLPGETQVYPAHGAGSLCGRQISSDASSTIDRERRFNYALQATSCEAFVDLITESLPPRPEYFAREVELNRRGAGSLERLPDLKPLSPSAVRDLQAAGAIVLDTRPVMQFAAAHIPGSLHIALTGQYASWAARLLGVDAAVVLCGEDDDHVRESQLRLARVGIEDVRGYIDGGVAAWILGGNVTEYIAQVAADELASSLQSHPDGVGVLDVREPGEVAGGYISGSTHIPLGQVGARWAELDPSKLWVVHCKGGYRSSIASSLLRRAGVPEVANLSGGFDAWSSAGLSCAKPAAASGASV
jgi:glyoxylase-like metal-dependent hydrolase (beta-lactamase superfamily II)/rhodanese-related sulfurtransferase